MGHLGMVRTVGGHSLPEVVSALQKSVRRGLVDDALYWAVDVYLSGYAEYAWKRLRIMCSEDVGLADPTLPAVIQALYQSYADQAKKTKASQDQHAPERLFFVHAVILLAMAPKSRMVDHALIHHFNRHAEAHRPVPDCALDKHTQRGRQLGRGVDHFFDEGSKLENQAPIDDPYRELAREAMKRPERGPRAPAEGGDLFSAARDGGDD
jgi:replication-associated recombination protein RarA